MSCDLIGYLDCSLLWQFLDIETRWAVVVTQVAMAMNLEAIVKDMFASQSLQ